jgi:hypothetical protein
MGMDETQTVRSKQGGLAAEGHQHQKILALKYVEMDLIKECGSVTMAIIIAEMGET